MVCLAGRFLMFKIVAKDTPYCMLQGRGIQGLQMYTVAKL